MVNRSQQSDHPRPVLSALRKATTAAHDRLHVHPLLNELTADHLTLDAYGRILEAFYGFYAPLEPRLIATAARLGIRQQYDRAVRTSWLVDDLRDLGRSTSQIRELPRFDKCITVSTLPQFAGCQYVIQGSTLGGTTIVRLLGQKENFDDSRAVRFFRSYGEQTLPRWRRLCRFLETTCSLPRLMDDAVAAAIQMFSALDQWFTQVWESGRVRP